MGLNLTSTPVKYETPHNLKLNYKKVKSKDAAMSLLNHTRKKLVQQGFIIAVRWAIAHNWEATTRDVLNVMVDIGIYKPGVINDYWLTPIFMKEKWRYWEWSGKFAEYEKPETAVLTQGSWHPVRVWRLKKSVRPMLLKLIAKLDTLDK